MLFFVFSTYDGLSLKSYCRNLNNWMTRVFMFKEQHGKDKKGPLYPFKAKDDVKEKNEKENQHTKLLNKPKPKIK